MLKRFSDHLMMVTLCQTLSTVQGAHPLSTGSRYGADQFLICASRQHKVAAHPKVHPLIVLPLPNILAGYVDGAFPPDEPDHLRNGVFRWNRYQHVNMIGPHVPFRYLALILNGQVTQHLAKVLTQPTIQNLAPAFRYSNQMVLTFPLCVA